MSLLELIDRSPRLSLAHLPTPLEPMPRLTAALDGPQLWVKRDDCTGLGLGGNKVRKLEFALADAIEHGADTVIGVGVPQSNAVRQLAAAAAKVGLRCHLVLLEGRVPGVEAEYARTGNALLDHLFGASVETLPWTADAVAHMAGRAEQLGADGAKPYVVPYGVSSAIGALGYSAMVVELAAQIRDAGLNVEAVVLAAGSGGTQGGMVVAVEEISPDLRVIGIDVDAEPDRVRSDVLRVGGELAGLAGIDAAVVADRTEVVGGYAGLGYGIPTPQMVEAVRTAARTEGLVLDPVYTGKAFAGFLDLVRSGEFDPGREVVFLHTGGSPALFAYRGAFEA